MHHILHYVRINEGCGPCKKGEAYGCTDGNQIWIDTDMHKSEASIMRTLAHERCHIERGDCGRSRNPNEPSPCEIIDRQLDSEGLHR